MAGRASRLRRIAGLAKAEERQQAEYMRRARAALNDARERLTELDAFRRKYAEAATRSGRIQSAHWKDRQDFAARLETAMLAQGSIVTDCERKFESQQRRWHHKRKRVESLLRVIDRFQAEDLVREDRLEQRRLDDRPDVTDVYGDDR